MTTVAAEPSTNAPKFTEDYQATDPVTGEPIGHPTHLTADTAEEMIAKMRKAHINATIALSRQNKAFDDLRKSKLTRHVEPVVKKLTETEKKQAVAGVANPATAEDSVRKLSGIESLEERLARVEKENLYNKGRAIGFEFCRKHPEFYQCDANSKALYKFLRDNGLEHTVDNLEIAFASLQDELAADPKKPVVNNDPANNDLPNNEPPNAPSSDLERRPPSFGVQPGTGTGARPTGRTVGMTKKDVIAKKKADPKWWKEAINNPTKLAEINAILARG
jgi:hypothetical protein